eukprot:TRINITY_DN2104_c0_g2_i4.p1 TRINITY_DN2104_c0_g2~~TRINITY_DN2104_c0_g2_i4.p1  ORF type:complete len:226 (-),score=53.40 TRINITY_DN2104_c0_g2_i4:682-1359(-)
MPLKGDDRDSAETCLYRFKNNCRVQGLDMKITDFQKLVKPSDLSWLLINKEMLNRDNAHELVRSVKMLNPYLDPAGLVIRHITLFNCLEVDDVLEVSSILSELLRNRFRVHTFEFIENLCDGSAVVPLALSVKGNEHLKQLSLSYNPLGDAGIINLVSGLKWNSCLEKLDLVNCYFGGEGQIAIADGLIANDYCVLSNLDIRGNHDRSNKRAVEWIPSIACVDQV